MRASKAKRAVSLSISEDVLRDARRFGVDVSDVVETALRNEVERLAHGSLQERMDRTMEFWNAHNRDHVTIADEFGTL